MPLQTTHELARSLTDEERQDLLEKITRTIEPDSSENDTTPHVETSHVERQKLVQSEIQKLSLLQRFLLFIKRLFSSRTEEEILFAMQMDAISRIIQDQDIELFRFDGRWLTADFAQLCYSFYRRIQPFLKTYGQFWKKKELLREMIDFILEKKIPNAKSSMLRFMTFEELQDHFEKHENIQTLKARLVHDIKHYISNIPEGVFQEIERGILPIYHSKAMALFDFANFFNAFQVDITEGDDTGEFYPVKAEYVFGELEELYHALNAVCDEQGSGGFHEEVFMYLASLDFSSENEKNTEYEPRRILKEIPRAADNLLKQGQFLNIIRFVKGDPYYEYKRHALQLRIHDFYHSSLQLKVLDELDAQFANIRKEVITKKKNKLFSQPIKTFDFFRRGISSVNNRLPVFRYVNSLTSLYNFLIQRFGNGFQETLKTVARFLMSRDRDIHASFIMNIASLEGLLESVRQFDSRFAPLSSTGKNFQRLRQNAEKDDSGLKPYQTFVVQKDKEVLECLAKARDQFSLLKQSLERIQSIERLGGNEANSSENASIKKQIDSILEELNSILKILFYEQQLEDEGMF